VAPDVIHCDDGAGLSVEMIGEFFSGNLDDDDAIGSRFAGVPNLANVSCAGVNDWR